MTTMTSMAASNTVVVLNCVGVDWSESMDNPPSGL